MIEYTCQRCGQQLDTGSGAGPCPRCTTERVVFFPPKDAPTASADNTTYRALISYLNGEEPEQGRRRANRQARPIDRAARKKARKAAKASRKRNRR